MAISKSASVGVAMTNELDHWATYAAAIGAVTFDFLVLAA